MNISLLQVWHWFTAVVVVFTLLGYAGLMMGHGQERPKAGPVRKPAARKETHK